MCSLRKLFCPKLSSFFGGGGGGGAGGGWMEWREDLHISYF